MILCIHLVYRVQCVYSFYFCENFVKLYSYFTDPWDTLTCNSVKIKLNCISAINHPAMDQFTAQKPHQNPPPHPQTHLPSLFPFKFHPQRGLPHYPGRSKPSRCRVVQFAVPVDSVSGHGHTSRPPSSLNIVPRRMGGGLWNSTSFVPSEASGLRGAR